MCRRYVIFTYVHLSCQAYACVRILRKRAPERARCVTTRKGGFIKNSTQIDDAVTMDIAIAIRSNASASTFIIWQLSRPHKRSIRTRCDSSLERASLFLSLSFSLADSHREDLRNYFPELFARERE